MVVVIVLSVIVWVSIPPVLSRVMVRRGYDGTSYLVVGAMFGPLAVALAVMDVLFDVPEPPRILEKDRTDHGELSVLVVIDGESTMSPPTTAVMDVEPHLRRLGLAQVLPKGGPREDERRAERGLRQAATGFHHPELVLLFGRPDVVIPEHAAANGYDIVLTAHPDPILSARLTKAGSIAAVTSRASSAPGGPALPGGIPTAPRRSPLPPPQGPGRPEPSDRRLRSPAARNSLWWPT